MILMITIILTIKIKAKITSNIKKSIKFFNALGWIEINKVVKHNLIIFN